VHKSTDSPLGSGVAAPGFLNREFKLLDRYELQVELVEALQKTEHHTRLVPKVAACHKSFRHKRCDRSHDWAKPFNSCSVRVCPHCAHRRGEILGARFQGYAATKDNLRYVVLSERNSKTYAEGRELLLASWQRLRRSVGWKRKVKGCIVAEEVTYNAEEKTWHPHLNILMEGEFFPVEELRQAWFKASEGRGEVVWITKANAGTVFELIKYVAKVTDLLERPEVLDEFLTAIKGRRLLRTYGVCRSMQIADEDDPSEEGEKCPDCGSKCVIDLGFVNAKQISFDFEKGVFRVKRKQRQVDDALRRAEEFSPSWFAGNLHPRPLTKLDHELARFRVLVSTWASANRTSVAATSRAKGAPQWQQQPQ
jgi:Replication protein